MDWTVSLPNKSKISFYNPIKQNQTHIKWLNNYLNDQYKDIPSYSIITFSERCELKKITVSNPLIYVIKRDRLYVTIKNIWKNTADVLDENTIEQLYKILKQLTNVEDAVKLAHIETTKSRKR